MRKHILAAAAALAASGAALAQSAPQASDLQFFAGIGITGEGDKLATVEFTDGSSQNIKSGGLVQVKAGINYRPGDAPWSLQASVGYHVDEANARNGDVRFSRYPVELLGFWHANTNIRLGGGVRYASDPRLKSSGAANDLGDHKLKSEAGLVLEGEYLFNRHMGLSLRLVSEDYKLPGGTKVDGDHMGIGFNYYF